MPKLLLERTEVKHLPDSHKGVCVWGGGVLEEEMAGAVLCPGVRALTQNVGNWFSSPLCLTKRRDWNRIPTSGECSNHWTIVSFALWSH